MEDMNESSSFVMDSSENQTAIVASLDNIMEKNCDGMNGEILTDDRKETGTTAADIISLDLMDSGSYDASSGYGTSKTAQQGSSIHKVKKKERVKECLRELKSLVMPNKESKTGLLSTLQQVVQRMKELKEEKHVDDCGFKQGETEMIGIDLIPGTGKTDISAKSYSIVMSLEETVVLQVTEDLTDMLGYPKHYWLDQSLTDFVRRKDIVTINNSLAEVCMRALSSVDPVKKPAENTFFFALRHYKSLRQGYNLLRSEKFTTFRAQANVVASPAGPSTSSDAPEKKFLLLECVPVYSAFLEKDVLPSMRTFNTKQTVFCNYCAVQHQAITLLGYLPQDMIGTSIFQYYHPNDLPMLLDNYEKILSNPGEKLVSTPYRMRCQNGGYIHLVTEWSSCVNTWSKKWDFIIGKHEVVRGPTNLDVFADPQTQLTQSGDIDLDYDTITTLENKIKSLFLQVGEVAEAATTGVKRKQAVMSETSSSRFKTNGSATEDEPSSSSTPDGCGHGEIGHCLPGAEQDVPRDKQIIQVNLLPLLQLQFSLSPRHNKQKSDSARLEDHPESGRRTGKDKKRDGVASKSRKGKGVVNSEDLLDENGGSSLVQGKASPGQGQKESSPSLSSWLSLCNNDLSLIYEGVNYASNIRRFLLSCPAMVSYNSSHEEEYQVQDVDDESGASCSEEDHISMGVDFQLPRPPSYASSTKALVSEQEHREELMPPSPSHNEETNEEMQNDSTSEEDYTPVTLTQNVLQMHDKNQVQSFLEGVIKEKSAYLMFMPNLNRRRMPRSSRALKRQAERGEDLVAPKLRITNDQQIQPQKSQIQATRQMLAPPFPITSIDTNRTITKSMAGPPGARRGGLTLPQDMEKSKFVTISNLCSVSANCDQLSPNSGRNLNSSAAPAKKSDAVGGFQWTICPQTGAPMLQPFMARPSYILPKSSLHYNPFGGPPIHGARNDDPPPPPPASATMVQPGNMPNMASLPLDSDCDDTGSSMRYLLESSNSHQQSSLSEESYSLSLPKKEPSKKEPSPPKNPEGNRPYWQQTVNWNKDLSLNYVAPVLDRKQVLDNDKALLRRLKQPTRVMHQLEELLSFQSTSETDGDSDVLLTATGASGGLSHGPMPHPSYQFRRSPGKKLSPKNDNHPQSQVKPASSSDGDGSDSLEEKADCSSPVKGIEKDASENGSSADSFEMSLEGSGSGSFPETASCDQTKSEQGTDKAGENELDNTSETGSSKGSSDFTPSDQRSHEDTSSSVKESDNASSHSGSSKAKSSSSSLTKARQMKQKKPTKTLSDDIFEQLFLPLKGKKHADQSNLKPAPWLVDVNFGTQVQMSYQHSLLDPDNTLRQDKIQLLHMTQPEMVYQQMSALRKEAATGDTLESGDSSESKSCSDNFEPQDMKDAEAGENEAGSSFSGEFGAKPEPLSFSRISENVETMKDTLNDLCHNRKMGAPLSIGGMTDSSQAGFGRMQRGDGVYSFDSRSATSSSACGRQNNKSSGSDKVCSSRSDSNPDKHSGSSSNQGKVAGSSGSHRGSSENISNSDSSGEPKARREIVLNTPAQLYRNRSYSGPSSAFVNPAYNHVASSTCVTVFTSPSTVASPCTFASTSGQFSAPRSVAEQRYPQPMVQDYPQPLLQNYTTAYPQTMVQDRAQPLLPDYPQPMTQESEPGTSDARARGDEGFVQFFLPNVFDTEEIDFMLED